MAARTWAFVAAGNSTACAPSRLSPQFIARNSAAVRVKREVVPSRVASISKRYVMSMPSSIATDRTILAVKFVKRILRTWPPKHFLR
jgi:hypothetical protein